MGNMKVLTSSEYSAKKARVKCIPIFNIHSIRIHLRINTFLYIGTAKILSIKIW